VIRERKCFRCGEFRHIVRNCRTKKKKETVIPQSSNRFEMLTNRVTNVGEHHKREETKGRKTILRKERLKKEKSRSKKNRRRRSIERIYSENRIGKDRYAERDHSGGIVR